MDVKSKFSQDVKNLTSVASKWRIPLKRKGDKVDNKEEAKLPLPPEARRAVPEKCFAEEPVKERFSRRPSIQGAKVREAVVIPDPAFTEAWRVVLEKRLVEDLAIEKLSCHPSIQGAKVQEAVVGQKPVPAFTEEFVKEKHSRHRSIQGAYVQEAVVKQNPVHTFTEARSAVLEKCLAEKPAKEKLSHCPSIQGVRVQEAVVRQKPVPAFTEAGRVVLEKRSVEEPVKHKLFRSPSIQGAKVQEAVVRQKPVTAFMEARRALLEKHLVEEPVKEKRLHPSVQGAKGQEYVVRQNPVPVFTETRRAMLEKCFAEEFMKEKLSHRLSTQRANVQEAVVRRKPITAFPEARKAVLEKLLMEEPVKEKLSHRPSIQGAKVQGAVVEQKPVLRRPSIQGPKAVDRQKPVAAFPEARRVVLAKRTVLEKCLAEDLAKEKFSHRPTIQGAKAKEAVVGQKKPVPASAEARRAVHKRFTFSDLLRSLGTYVHSQCRDLVSRPTAAELVSTWVRGADAALLAGGWTLHSFLLEAHIVFTYMLVQRAFERFPVKTLLDAKELVLMCLYISYTYNASEISYPLRPFLVKQNRVAFWSKCTELSLSCSRQMLKLNRSRQYYMETLASLKSVTFPPNKSE